MVLTFFLTTTFTIRYCYTKDLTAFVINPSSGGFELLMAQSHVLLDSLYFLMLLQYLNYVKPLYTDLLLEEV